jgi:hypothetical protein
MIEGTTNDEAKALVASCCRLTKSRDFKSQAGESFSGEIGVDVWVSRLRKF